MSDKNKQTADVQLLDVLERVTESDLQSIDEKIAELQRQIDGLTAVRRVIDRRLHGSPTRTKKPAANTAKGGGRRQRCARGGRREPAAGRPDRGGDSPHGRAALHLAAGGLTERERYGDRRERVAIEAAAAAA